MTPSRISLIFTIIFSLGVSAVSAELIREKELKRIELNKKYDKLKLRERNDFVTDCSKDFLVELEEKAAAGKFSVAKVPPSVKMRIIPGMKPEYFTDMDEDGEAYMVAWASCRTALSGRRPITAFIPIPPGGRTATAGVG